MTTKTTPDGTAEGALRSVINALVGDCRVGDFLEEHGDFLEHHLDFIFCKKEGVACSHDKTRTVISLLKKHFESGEAISINYEQEYTYHLPRTVLNNHGAILEIYLALSCLYYGNPSRYLVVVQKLFVEAPHDK